jgi:hypothetical protein
MRLINALKETKDDNPAEAWASTFGADASPQRGRAIVAVIERYGRNKRLIEAVCRTYAVRPLSVWQPAPSYKYDLKRGTL